MDKGSYHTQSFQTVAATSSIEAGISDVQVKMLGRWKSDAYQCYIRTPLDELASLSKKMISGLLHLII